MMVILIININQLLREWKSKLYNFKYNIVKKGINNGSEIVQTFQISLQEYDGR